MKLLDIIVKDAVIPELASSTRDDAVAELIDALVAAGRVDPSNRDDFVKAVILRENKGSTGFGHGVAVPHVKHSSVTTMSVAVGNSGDGIDFKSLDRQPVHSIMLLLSPEDKPEDHLDAMEAIFGNLSQDTFRRFLRQATSPDDVITLLEEADATAR